MSDYPKNSTSEFVKIAKLSFFKKDVEIYDKQLVLEKVSEALNFYVDHYNHPDPDSRILQTIYEYLKTKMDVDNIDLAATIHHHLYQRLDMMGNYIYKMHMERTYWLGDKMFPVAPESPYSTLLESVTHYKLDISKVLHVKNIKKYEHGHYLIKKNKSEMIVINYIGDKSVFGESKHALLLMATGEWTLGII